MSDLLHVLKPLLDSDQAAAYAKVHKKTLHRHARLGMVPSMIRVHLRPRWGDHRLGRFRPMVIEQ